MMELYIKSGRILLLFTQYPELSDEEVQTIAYIEKMLKTMGYKPQRFGQNGGDFWVKGTHPW